MNDPIIDELLKYINKFNRRPLYRQVINTFNIESILYPGSHIDIEPSFLCPKVTYVDNFKGAIKFFKHLEIIKAYVEKHKEFSGAFDISFIGEDYHNALDTESVDLIISQYGGFVGQATKKYLKTNGYLLCNDSHGDATLAMQDKDYKLIAVMTENYQIKRRGLDQYFKLKGNKAIDLNQVKSKMKGPKYTVNAENYIFKKL